MAIATYADLLSAVASWLNRDDLTSRIPDFVVLFEARAKRDLRDWLRTSITATSVTADYQLPATVSDVLSVSYNDGAAGSHNFTLDLVTKETYQGLMEASSAVQSVAGQVAYVDVDVDGGTTTLRFWPPASVSAPIANLKIEAVKVLAALSGTANALMREAPDLYLYGTLAESAPYLQHDERLPMWQSRADEGFKELRIQTERRLYGGVPRNRQLDRIFG